jgi:hypothetical protein
MDGHVQYVLYEPDILNIFSKYSLKIPQIYSNISLSDGREGLSGVMDGRVVQGTDRRPNNPDSWNISKIYAKVETCDWPRTF